MTDTAAGSPTLPIQPIQPTSLDPADPAAWEAFRAQAHRMLDDMIGHLRTLRGGSGTGLADHQGIPEITR